VRGEPSSLDTANKPVPADVPGQSFVVINLRDLFSFLVQYEKHWPDVAVVCPWNGVPLPSTEIKSDELNGQLKFSVEMILALINFQKGTMPFQREKT